VDEYLVCETNASGLMDWTLGTHPQISIDKLSYRKTDQSQTSVPDFVAYSEPVAYQGNPKYAAAPLTYSIPKTHGTRFNCSLMACLQTKGRRKDPCCDNDSGGSGRAVEEHGCIIHHTPNTAGGSVVGFKADNPPMAVHHDYEKATQRDQFAPQVLVELEKLSAAGCTTIRTS
jgi:hypothetical protein